MSSKPSKQQNKITVSIHKSTREFLADEFKQRLNETNKQLSVADLIEMVCQEVREYREKDMNELEK